MCKNSVYFSAPPLSVSAPPLHLLWRRHYLKILNVFWTSSVSEEKIHRFDFSIGFQILKI